MCKCMTTINNDLKQHNTKLSSSFILTRDSRGMDVLPIIQTEKRDTKTRGKATLVVPTYCPFCGVKYPRAGEEAGEEADVAADRANQTGEVK